MSARPLALVAGSLLLALALPQAASAGYPLTCRGGGTMAIVNSGSGNVHITFQAGAGGIAAGLNPGECTWSDRALYPGEPTQVCDTAASASGYVNLLVQESQYMVFQVNNDGAGCMKVERTGP